jgi:enoyl-CoA hydratase/carnithine racemase
MTGNEFDRIAQRRELRGCVRFTREGTVATLILECVERRNAISATMWSDLASMFRKLANETDVRAVVVRGAPEGGAFSAGADLTEFPEVRSTSERALAHKEQIYAALEAIEACPVPVISVIDGACIGGGLEIAMYSDLRLASVRSTFGLPIVRIANAIDIDDIRRLAQVAGPALAAEILLTGVNVPAERAYAAGLVNWVGPVEELYPAAQRVVKHLVAAAPRAVRLAKQGLRVALVPSAGGGAAYEKEVRRVLSGQDFQEGYRAFLERRPPAFTGE